MPLVEDTAPLAEPLIVGTPLPSPARPKTPVHEVILPSGRAVRLRTVTTAEYLDAKERAASNAGDLAKRPDPRGTRFARELDREMVALAVVAYTDCLDWTPSVEAQVKAQAAAHETMVQGLAPEARPPFEFQPDTAALLNTLPETAWHATTPLALVTPGDGELFAVFSDVADWEVLTRVAGDLLLPRRNMAAFVGKAQRVMR